ncbi:MAG: hypothetical protein HY720_00355 [Planctomycetes bacterium]|nr:hypothetical protein [Planctomycetota bacterium]
MIDPDAPLAAERLRLALDLFDSGVAIMRQKLRRELPEADEAEIEKRLGAWLQERPGAEHGDSVGRPISWPPPRR